jgi:hypothetical protein
MGTEIRVTAVVIQAVVVISFGRVSPARADLAQRFVVSMFGSVFDAWLCLALNSAQLEVEFSVVERYSATQGVEGVGVEIFPGIGGAELE